MLENFGACTKILPIANGFMVELPPLPQKNQSAEMGRHLKNAIKNVDEDPILANALGEYTGGGAPLWDIQEQRIYYFTSFDLVLNFLAKEMAL